MDLVINKDLTIPGDQFQFSYVRSGGPGGQNVNKVSSKVISKVVNKVSTARKPLRDKAFRLNHSRANKVTNKEVNKVSNSL